MQFINFPVIYTDIINLKYKSKALIDRFITKILYIKYIVHIKIEDI